MYAVLGHSRHCPWKCHRVCNMGYGGCAGSAAWKPTTSKVPHGASLSQASQGLGSKHSAAPPHLQADRTYQYTRCTSRPRSLRTSQYQPTQQGSVTTVHTISTEQRRTCTNTTPPQHTWCALVRRDVQGPQQRHSQVHRNGSIIRRNTAVPTLHDQHIAQRHN